MENLIELVKPLPFALVAFLVAVIGEWLHARRCRVVSRLAFGVEEKPRLWTRFVPFGRIASLTAMTWGLSALLLLPPRAQGGAPQEVTADTADISRILFIVDVSPSMQIVDAGPDGDKRRAEWLAEVVDAILRRIDDGNVRYSVQAFYTDAHFVLQDAADVGLVYNVFDDLPLALAFKPGETDMGVALKKSFDVIKEWPHESATVFLCTDGDTVELGSLPPRPKSVQDFIVLGVGDPRRGTQIGDRKSQQGGLLLSRLSYEMNGRYSDVNRRHLPTSAISRLSGQGDVTLEDEGLSVRQWAITAISTSAVFLALTPSLLLWFGTGWRVPGRARKDDE